MPLAPESAVFLSAELADLATLTGLVVVAISINLPRILSFARLPTRAGEPLIGPIGAVTVTSLVLIPEQPVLLWRPRSFSLASSWSSRRLYSRPARGPSGRTLGRYAGGQHHRLQPGIRRRKRARTRGRPTQPLLDRSRATFGHHRGRVECVGADGRDFALRLFLVRAASGRTPRR